MNNTIKSFLIISILLIDFSIYGQVKNWHQFRGYNRDGISEETGLLNEWPETGPELLWKQKITDSFSGIVIVDNIIYTNSSDTVNLPGSEILAAYKVETGEQIWATEFDSVFIDPDGWGNGPRSTPYVDEETVYVQSSFAKLAAVNKADGKLKWTVDFMKEFGTVRPRWGYSSTLSIVNDVIFAYAAGNEGNAYVGIDKKTGKVLWSKGKGWTECYTSPKVVEIDGVTNIVFINDTMIVSLDKNGQELWSFKTPTYAGNAMLTFIPPNKFFVSRVSRVGSYLVEVNGTEVKEIWQNPTLQENWNSPIYYKGYIYGFSKGKLMCISLEDGNATWAQRGYGKGSAIIVDDKIFALTERGVLNMVETNPEMYIEKASFQALDGKSWTAPTFYDGKLFLRNQQEMAAYKLK